MTNVMTLTQANREWANRPADERMPSLEAMHAAALAQRTAAVEKQTEFANLRVKSDNDQLYLEGKSGIACRLMNYAFTQLCGRVGAPAEYLSELPATLAANNLNHGLAKRIENVANSALANILFHKNGEWLVRSVMTERYDRFWNCELTERLLDRQRDGWEPARPDIGDANETALYVGDRNMFAFLRLRENYIEQPFKNLDKPIYKGFICWNSEVGDRTLGAMSFLYNGMCCNHLIWGAQNVFEVNIKHVGDTRQKFALFAAKLREYARASMSDDSATIKRAASKLIASTKEDVLDTLFGKRSLKLTRTALDTGYDAVKQDEDGDPRTVWGIVQGLTRYSQTIPYADQRTEIDKNAGRILEMVDSF